VIRTLGRLAAWIKPTRQSALRLSQAFLCQGFQFRSDLFEGGGKANL
jgi:hypothetical protein